MSATFLSAVAGLTPVNKSPRATMSGTSFTQGTYQRHGPYSLRSPVSHQPPLPTDFPGTPEAAARAVTRLSYGPQMAYYSVVRLLAVHRTFPLRLSAYRVRYPGATREHDEPSRGSRPDLPYRAARKHLWCDGWIRMLIGVEY